LTRVGDGAGAAVIALRPVVDGDRDARAKLAGPLGTIAVEVGAVQRFTLARTAIAGVIRGAGVAVIAFGAIGGVLKKTGAIDTRCHAARCLCQVGAVLCRVALGLLDVRLLSVVGRGVCCRRVLLLIVAVGDL
jgi:hypothetical protein